MRIDFLDEEYVVVHCTYDERHIPKAAGFAFDPDRRKWATGAPGRALTLVDFCTDRARQALGLGGSIPVPDGLAYLNFQIEGIEFARPRPNTLIADQPGLGKGHPVSTRVLTPGGWKAVGDLRVGDKVITFDGSPTKVTGVFDRGLLPIYMVGFHDGAEVQVDAEHLWTVIDADDVPHDIDTLQLAAALHNRTDLAIPTLSGPAEVNPTPGLNYLLAGAHFGSLLCSRKRRFEVFAEPPNFGDPRDYAMGAPGQLIDFMRGVVNHCGLIRDHHLDLDFVRTAVGEQMAAAVLAIVRQLGGLAYVIRKFRRLRVQIHLPAGIAYPMFGYMNYTGGRLQARWQKFKPGVPRRTVAYVRASGRDQVRCIAIEDASRLYVTEHHILTHNTIQAIGLFNGVPQLKNGLIIPPASLKTNWLKEWEKWTTRKDLSIDICYGTKNFPTSDVVIINYDILQYHADSLRAKEWHVGAFDEAHALKNKDAKRTKHVIGGMFEEKDPTSKKKKRFRIEPIPLQRSLFLSGTPLANKTGDLWPIIQRCDPTGMGKDYYEFHKYFCGAYYDAYGQFVPNGVPEDSRLRELNGFAKDRFMIRRMKADVLKELPEKIRQIVPLPPDGLKAKINAEKKALTDLLDAYEKMIGIQGNMTDAELVDAVMRIPPTTWEKYAAAQDDEDTRLDMPLNRLANARQELAVAKLPMVIEYVNNLLEQDEKVVVFGYHRAVIEGLQEHFRKSNRMKTACIYGATPMESARHPERTRQAQAEMFQNDDLCRLFIGQYTAAGTGWTLTAARHWVAAELTWVPHELLQAEDRIHRIGSEIHGDTVWCHHLVAQGSMDDAMVSRLVEKMRIIELALD